MNSLDSILSIITNLIGIFTFICSVYVVVFRKFKILYNKRLYRPECVTEEEIKKYTNIYIQTRLVYNNEMLYAYKFIDNLLKTSTQYYLVLGETGMGKSSFLLNCYFYFLLKIFKKGYSVYFLTMRDKSIFNKILEIDNKRNSILLLDAFDESIQEAQKPEEILAQIENSTKDFSKIVITSRANFFNSKEEEPDIVSNFKAIDVEDTKYEKYYIANFTESDIKKYLLKKYGLKIRMQHKAIITIKKCNYLMSIPLILSYIDSIIGSNKVVKYSYEVYQIIVENIISREVQFIIKSSCADIESKEILIKNYWEFLNEISIIMYYNISEYYEPIINREIVDSYKISSFYNNCKRNRALLERNYNDFFTFSHRSIFEYFIAKNITEIKGFKFDSNLTQTYRFLAEMYEAGNPNVRGIIKESPEDWCISIELSNIVPAKIIYNRFPKDEIVFKFVKYDMKFICKQLIEIIDRLNSSQNSLCKIDNVYAINRINELDINLHYKMQMEQIDQILSKYIAQNSKLKIIKNYVPITVQSNIKILGGYEVVYKV